MSKTRIRPNLQITNSRVYDDTLAAGATLESNPVFIEDDLNGLRSQVNKIIGVTNWYDALSGRDLADLHTDLADIEGKKVLCRSTVLTDVTVGGTDNWAILSVAGSEAPSQVAAINAGTLGAVVAVSAFSGAGFAANELVEVAGSDATNPKNLVTVRDSTTGQPLQSGGKDIFGLLQVESTGTDGVAFNDTSAGNRVKISFVILNGGLDDLIACPAVDIQGKTINYAYVFRSDLDTIPEDCFLANGSFVDQSASVDVTRQNAYDNQGATAVDLTNNATLDLEGAGLSWSIRDDLEANLLSIVEGSAGGTSQVNIHGDVDEFDVDAAVNDFLQGVTVDSGGTALNLGVTAGQIDSAGALNLLSGGAANAKLASPGGEIFLDDTNQTGSTWAQTDGIKLSETTAEWDTFETNFGEVSLLNAINQAFSNGGGTTRTKGVAIVTANIAADANATGAGGTPNLDAQLPDHSAVTFVTDVDIFLNGDLLRNGADASANHDVYPGDTPANGDLKFEFGLEASPGNPDTITSIVWA